MHALRAFLSISALLLCALVVAGIPGSSVRPVVFTLTAPPLPPETKDRDASVRVTARGQDQAPISGASVNAFAIVGGRAYASGSARTAAGGAATLRGLPRGEHWIVADAPGRARAATHVVLVDGERAIDLELGVEFVAKVEVRDEQGAPLAGAEIEIVGREPLPIGARTGADGGADVGRLGPPPWTVTARASGYEEVTQRGVRDSGVRFTLRKLGAIVARVVLPDGAPAPGARVLVAGPSLWPARAAETSADGSVRIGALAAGAYAMRATHGDDVSPVELSVALGRGEEKELVLRLTAGVRVPVRAVDEEDAPIAGARVTLVEAGISPFPVEATTDRAGRASLGPIARGPSSVAASAEGFVPRGAVSVVEPITEVKIVLGRAGALEGRVVDARGFPIDGASIVVVGTDFTGAPIDEDPRRARFREAHFDTMLRGPAPLLPMGELGVMPGPVPPIPHAVAQTATLPLAGAPAPAPPPEPWVTRNDGTFKASPVSPGRVRVLVRHPQFTDALSELVTLKSGAEAHVEVVMRAGGTLEGRVVDASGRPVAGARVTMAAVKGSTERATKSATDGTFAFAAVPEEIVVSVARDEDTEPAARLPVKVAERERKSITIALPEPRLPLDARVVDDRGYPIDAAQISVQSLEPGAPLRVTVFTNARGEAQIPSARGLALRAEVRASARAPEVVTVEREATGLMVTLAPAESARGEVRAAVGRGDPIEGAEIVLYTELGARHTRTDRDGAYTVNELAAGPARLRVRAQGFAPKELDVTIDAAGGARPVTLPRIELGGEGSVEGLVVDGRGDPVQGARIAKDRVPVFLAVGATPPGVAVTDARGRFRLAELAEGTCALEIYAPDLGRTRLESVKVTAGRTNDLGKVTLKKEGEVATDPTTRGNVAVTLGEASDAREVVLVAVAEGTEAERAGLAPGDVLVEVDGVQVHTIAEARAKLSGPLGDDVVVKLRRGGHALTLRVAREEVRR